MDNISNDGTWYRSVQEYATQGFYPATQSYPATDEYTGTYSRTPSPADSGIDSSPPPDLSPKQSADSVEETLAKLSEKSQSLVKTEVSFEKPPYSFLALVSKAILSSPDRKLLLGDIYQYIMDNFPYYNNEQKAWRNSIRHNLSLNECFIKDGRSDCGRGSYWSIHPAVQDDFARGDFRRRQARRKSRSNVKAVSGGTAASTQIGPSYVAMTPTSIGYHPYSMTSTGYTGSAASGQQQTTSGATYTRTMCNTANDNDPHSVPYQYCYPPSTAFFNQPPTSGHDMMSQTSVYNKNAVGTRPYTTSSVNYW